MLAAAVAKSGDVAAVQQVIARIGDPQSGEWQRAALLQGLDAGLPSAVRAVDAAAVAAGGGGRGQQARRGRRVTGRSRRISVKLAAGD